MGHRVCELVFVGSLLGLVIWAGCGKSSGGVTVSGTVTFDGRPVEEGYVTFSPADGKGPARGGPIKDGKFTVTDVMPGEKIVSVTGGGKMVFPKSSEEMAQMAARGEKPSLPPQIPPNAKGNNQKIVVTSQPHQTLELTLSSPEK